MLKQYRELTYEEPAFHIEGSDAFRTFARLEMGQHPSKSVLQENNKAISDKAWEAIHNEILGYARREKMEKGRTVRVDSTAVETDIHHPADSSLLAGGIRLRRERSFRLSPFTVCDHTRVVKKRLIINPCF
ncbi:MAG TPA: hypothetical protein DCZ04_13170 [Syntrophorhabdus aromaticivorans]|nr:hypothetical protein [Syntrophorhabdus aromaticivorans]